MIRKPAVAGTFYPSNLRELRQFLDEHLKPVPAPIPAKAVVLPHAGYIYSGVTASLVLSRVLVPETVFLIGPNHRGLGADFALFSKGEWQTPLGRVPIHEELAAKLLEASHDLQVDTQAHALEHSLEVEIPLLQFRNPALRIAPLIVGTLNIEAAREVALAAGDVLASLHDQPLTVISTDMSHYEPEEATRKKDRYALEAIQSLDAEALLRVVKDYRITMCGLVPVYMLLVMKEALGLQKATLVDYRTSAEATGDLERVVGYAGFIFE